MRLPKPRSGEITLEELEEHLTEECGLTIHDMLEYHPTENQGSTELWNFPEDNYEHYDRVLSTQVTDKGQAEGVLLRYCMRLGCRRVGEMFRSQKYWCVRVVDVEV
jgi:hypothetical protein